MILNVCGSIEGAEIAMRRYAAFTTSSPPDSLEGCHRLWFLCQTNAKLS